MPRCSCRLLCQPALACTACTMWAVVMRAVSFERGRFYGILSEKQSLGMQWCGAGIGADIMKSEDKHHEGTSQASAAKL